MLYSATIKDENTHTNLWYKIYSLIILHIHKLQNNSSIRKMSFFLKVYTLEGMMLKLKLQYFGHLMQRTDSMEKTLMLGKIEGGKRRGQQRMIWLDGITDSVEFE